LKRGYEILIVETEKAVKKERRVEQKIKQQANIETTKQRKGRKKKLEKRV